jgi:hypothetical protein
LNPIVWTVAISFVAVGLFSLPPDATDLFPPFFVGISAVAMVLGALAVGWLGWSLKWVARDETALYVRGLRATAVVPLAEIEVVRQTRWLNRHVTVSFRRETDAGMRVVFLPARTRWAFWREDEVVAELRRAAADARTRSGAFVAGASEAR